MAPSHPALVRKLRVAVSMVPVEPELELAKPLSRIVFRVMYLVAGIFRLVQSYVKINGGKKQYIYNYWCKCVYIVGKGTNIKFGRG